MRDYGKVAPTFWTGRTGRRLRGNVDAQLLALYLFTGPASTMSGLFQLSLPAMAHETGLPLERVRQALEVLHQEDVAHFDEETDLVWVVNMIRFQVGEAMDPTDKRVIGLRREIAIYRGHPFVVALIERSQGAYHLPQVLLSPLRGASNGPSVALPAVKSNGHHVQNDRSKPLRSQDQDQDQDQEKDQEQEQGRPEGALVRVIPGLAPGRALSGPLTPNSGEIGEVVDHYRRLHPRAFPAGLRKSSRESKLLIGRLREGFTTDELKLAIDGYHTDPWHLGVNDRNMSYLGLDLIMRDSAHVQKGIEMQQRGPPMILSDKEKQGALASSAWIERMARTEGEE